MSKYKDMTLDDVFPFGRHKGKNIGQLVIEAPHYLLWIRSERIEESNLKGLQEKTFGFDDEVNSLLDDILEAAHSNGNYKHYLSRPHLKNSEKEEALKKNYSTNIVEKKIEGWGAF